MPRRVAPTDPDCGPGSENAAANGSSLHIVSPLRGLVYTERAAHPIPLALRADTGANTRAIYWFAGRSFIGRAPAGENLTWTPNEPGRYTLRAVDDGGGADTRELEVEVLP
jgi:penicillin-binding protein 1C